MARKRRLYSPTLAAGSLALGDEPRKHAQVLRLGAGEEVCLYNAAGDEADARVVRSDKRQLLCELAPPRHSRRPAAQLHMIIGVPKAAKLELIVRMATELGVTSVTLAHSERSVPRLSSESPRLERLHRIAIEACGQSERAWAPELHGPLPLAAAAARAPAAAERLLFWEGASAPLALNVSASEARVVWAIVGPEGGIGEAEADVLSQSGYVPVSLGSGILRVETACVVVASLLLDRIGCLR